MAPDIQSLVGIIMGIAVATERILETFWIGVKYVLAQGFSFNFRDFDNAKHYSYLKFKQLKEITSVFLGVCVGIGLARMVATEDGWTKDNAFFCGAIAGLISPHAHTLISAGLRANDILAAKASDNKETAQVKEIVNMAAERAAKYDEKANASACCFFFSPIPNVWNWFCNGIRRCDWNCSCLSKQRQALEKLKQMIKNGDILGIDAEIKQAFESGVVENDLRDIAKALAALGNAALEAHGEGQLYRAVHKGGRVMLTVSDEICEVKEGLRAVRSIIEGTPNENDVESLIQNALPNAHVVPFKEVKSLSETLVAIAGMTVDNTEPNQAQALLASAQETFRKTEADLETLRVNLAQKKHDFNL